MNYTNNTVGKQCVCCGEFYPIEGIDDYGHKITYPINKIGLCDECFNTLLKMIRENNPKNKDNRY